MPTSVRIALLAGLLALVSNLAVLGFIYWRTHDEAASALRRQVIEQGAVLADVYRTGGMTALQDAIQDSTSFGDPQTAVALFDASGHQQVGNLASLPSSQGRLREGFRNGLLRFQGATTPEQAALDFRHLPTGQWLVSGRTVADSFALRQTIERSLLIALAVAVLLGLACGVILANYVGRRIGGIVEVTSRITARDLSRRVPLSNNGDAFDRLGHRINEMLDRISTLMDELRMVTDTLAHDLRSPVGRLRAAAHAAAETSDPGERDQHLGNLLRQADSLTRMLATALEISRSEAMTGREQFAWFDVGELTAELCEMYEPVAEEAGARLDIERTAGALPIFGHRQLIAQAVSNLVENAIRYGAEGGDIHLLTIKEKRRLIIAVTDRGPGIPAERRTEALRRFGRLDSSRSDEGAGLGLALVRSIAHLHGGELVLEENAPGLIAMLQLPVSDQAPPSEAPVTQPV
ncbi:signal transduction histidine kinase [Sphingomonas sp. F9_3S_D5_B_2]